MEIKDKSELELEELYKLHLDMDKCKLIILQS